MDDQNSGRPPKFFKTRSYKPAAIKYKDLLLELKKAYSTIGLNRKVFSEERNDTCVNSNVFWQIWDCCGKREAKVGDLIWWRHRCQDTSFWLQKNMWLLIKKKALGNSVRKIIKEHWRSFLWNPAHMDWDQALVCTKALPDKSSVIT